MGRRVLIVDDHAGFRASARRLLECEGFDVVGEAADGAEALAIWQSWRPTWCCWTSACPMLTGATWPNGWFTRAALPSF